MATPTGRWLPPLALPKRAGKPTAPPGIVRRPCGGGRCHWRLGLTGLSERLGPFNVTVSRTRGWGEPGQVCRILFVGTYGAEWPARASMPFAAALIAANAGDEPQLLLRADATLLVKESVARQVQADEWPALADLLRRVVAHGIPVYA